jgi:phosphoribosylaminoimidazole-succinocarboxamide synthase
MSAIVETELDGCAGLRLLGRGKVRDLYALEGSPDQLLMVASDRISAFDHVLGSPVPDKGVVLNQLSLFWFARLEAVVPNHVVHSQLSHFPAPLQPFAGELRGRSVIVQRAEMFPVECVVRGYLSGSGWADYQASGAVCGVELPVGLREGDRLPEPVFTPAAKNNVGHDENISFAEMVERVGAEDAERLRELSLRLYTEAAAHAEACGLILADTKFEFGRVGGRIVLADEALTPDSSRYWLREGWKPGGAQPSFDKQFVRDYLRDSGWNREAPAPALPAEVVRRTREKYLEAYRLLTGRELAV